MSTIAAIAACAARQLAAIDEPSPAVARAIQSDEVILWPDYVLNGNALPIRVMTVKIV